MCAYVPVYGFKLFSFSTQVFDEPEGCVKKNEAIGDDAGEDDHGDDEEEDNEEEEEDLVFDDFNLNDKDNHDDPVVIDCGNDQYYEEDRYAFDDRYISISMPVRLEQKPVKQSEPQINRNPGLFDVESFFGLKNMKSRNKSMKSSGHSGHIDGASTTRLRVMSDGLLDEVETTAASAVKTRPRVLSEGFDCSDFSWHIPSDTHCGVKCATGIASNGPVAVISVGSPTRAASSVSPVHAHTPLHIKQSPEVSEFKSRHDSSTKFSNVETGAQTTANTFEAVQTEAELKEKLAKGKAIFERMKAKKAAQAAASAAAASAAAASAAAAAAAALPNFTSRTTGSASGPLNTVVSSSVRGPADGADACASGNLASLAVNLVHSAELRAEAMQTEAEWEEKLAKGKAIFERMKMKAAQKNMSKDLK